MRNAVRKFVNTPSLLDDVFNYSFDSLIDNFSSSSLENIVRKDYEFKISEDGRKLYFQMEVPGYSSANLKIQSTSKDNKVQIEGSRKVQSDTKTINKVFTFNSKWNIEEPEECKCEHGILYMTFVSKEPENKVKTISIS